MDDNLEGELEITADGVQRKRPYVKKFERPDSDEDVQDVTKLFNVQEAWRTLLSLPTCQKVMVT